MLKKTLLTTLVLGMTAMASVAFAAVTSTQAIEIAKAETSAGAGVFSYEDELHKYEIKLQDPATMTRYEVEVDKISGKVLEVTVKVAAQESSAKVVKSAEDIKAIVLAEYPDARIIGIHLDKEDYGHKYEVKFANAKYRIAELDINPETGVIVERDLKYNL